MTTRHWIAISVGLCALTGCGSAAATAATTPTAIATPVATPTPFANQDNSAQLVAALRATYKDQLIKAGYTSVVLSAGPNDVWCTQQSGTQSYDCSVLFSAVYYGQQNNWQAEMPGICDSTGSCTYEGSTHITIIH